MLDEGIYHIFEFIVGVHIHSNFSIYKIHDIINNFYEDDKFLTIECPKLNKL